jgi:hypothetical protein
MEFFAPVPRVIRHQVVIPPQGQEDRFVARNTLDVLSSFGVIWCDFVDRFLCRTRAIHELTRTDTKRVVSNTVGYLN